MTVTRQDFTTFPPGIVDHNCLNYERKFKQWLHYLFKINRNNSKIKLLIFSVFTDFKIVIFSVYTELKLSKQTTSFLTFYSLERGNNCWYSLLIFVICLFLLLFLKINKSDTYLKFSLNMYYYLCSEMVFFILRIICFIYITIDVASWKFDDRVSRHLLSTPPGEQCIIVYNSFVLVKKKFFWKDSVITV
jgi:hypothetical protein